MTLHIGNNQIVAQEDIVVILPVNASQERKSCVLLADGTMQFSSISSATLKLRLAGEKLDRRPAER